MPVHDWTRVPAWIFHGFHFTWLVHIARCLNHGLLPSDHYALIEQISKDQPSGLMTIEVSDSVHLPKSAGAVIGASTRPPQVWFHTAAEIDCFAAKVVAIRRTSDHRVVAVVQVVSPGKKSSRHALREYVEHTAGLLRARVNLLILDLFPPSPRDPQGIHKAIWDELTDNDFTLPPERPLTLAAYIGGPISEAFVEPMAVGKPLPDMPIFLTPENYIPVPLDVTYNSTWEEEPAFWRDKLTAVVS